MDMLVNLYEKKKETVDLPDGVRIHKTLSFEKGIVKDFVKKNFPDSTWDEEIDGGLNGPSPTVYVASKKGEILGFAAYEVTAKGFIGPLGVSKEWRQKGIGEALVLACFHSLKEMGYAYAIIGFVGSEKWYKKTFGAVAIGNSVAESVYSQSVRFGK